MPRVQTDRQLERVGTAITTAEGLGTWFGRSAGRPPGGWHAQAADAVDAVVDFPADAAGVVLRQLVAAGVEVSVGTPIALLGDVAEQGSDAESLLAALNVGDRRPAPR